MHISRNQTMAALILLLAGLSAIQAMGALSLVSAAGAMASQASIQVNPASPPFARGR